MTPLETWRLTYHESPGIDVDLGLVSADWLRAFSFRLFDQGARFEPGVLEHRIILSTDRYFSITNPRSIRNGDQP